jgi:ABC-type glycerol-3-phosphate transport system substrate-binding protein
MNPRKLITTLAAFALLAGAGVAGALASSPAQAPAGTSTATIACDDQGEQGENEEADAATEVEQAATEVDQEAAREQADDQEGDDQPGEQGDEQGENEDCGD